MYVNNTKSMQYTSCCYGWVILIGKTFGHSSPILNMIKVQPTMQCKLLCLIFSPAEHSFNQNALYMYMCNTVPVDRKGEKL